jgi:predicted TIM-barrel fold metal-dependent hydrolase
MDKAGVATAITSITTPGVSFGDPVAARRLARECNEYAARLVVDFPGRFGVFAALPLPDIEGSLRETAYALDVLKADGVCMFTSYGDRWLGDPEFTPVMAELDRRKAVLYTHPTAPNCCRNLVPDVPAPIIEYGTDTTRTIASLVFSGTAARFPNIRFIFSHRVARCRSSPSASPGFPSPAKTWSRECRGASSTSSRGSTTTWRSPPTR